MIVYKIDSVEDDVIMAMPLVDVGGNHIPVSYTHLDVYKRQKYEYVIATHIDKGHCHNHIIFNAVNFVDYHSYRSRCV